MDTQPDLEVTAESADAERMRRLKESLRAAQYVRNLPALLRYLTQTRADFAAMMQARRRNGQTSQEAWTGLLALLDDVHALEAKTVTKLRVAKVE